jgi:hypothetical protein
MVPKGFSISLGGVPVPSVPKGMDFDVKVHNITQKEKLWMDLVIRTIDY